MDRFRHTLPLLALCLVPLTYAEARREQPCNSALLSSLASQLGQNGWFNPGDNSDTTLVAAACKPWPDDSNLSVVTLAYRSAEDTSPPGERNLNWLIAKVDAKNGQLRERHDDFLGEDAMLEVDANSLWIDTARYHLAPGVRAFGVVVRSVARGASCPDAGFNDLFTLVVPDSAQLRPVLSTYLHSWTTVKGTNCVAGSGFESEQADLTLGLAATHSHGYADLIVTAQVRPGWQAPTQRKASTTLHYDGKRYPFEQYATFWWNKPLP